MMVTAPVSLLVPRLPLNPSHLVHPFGQISLKPNNVLANLSKSHTPLSTMHQILLGVPNSHRSAPLLTRPDTSSPSHSFILPSSLNSGTVFLTGCRPSPLLDVGCRAVAPKRSGFLSAIDRAMQDEEYRKARAQVNRKGLDVEGYIIEGVSTGGHETCVVVPALNAAFDIGRCPQRAVNQDFLFITHAHLDHIGGLPMYVATRALYNLKPPTVFVPPCIKDDVEKLLDIHRAMSHDELKVELVALDIGETYEIRNDLVVRPFKTCHVIPSQGYVLYSVRKKLKKQYMHLKGPQIKKLKFSGVEITDTILSPEVAFTGDTKSDFILEPRNADALRAKILITEATFLDEECDIDHARQRGHMHILELMEHFQWFRNKAILLTHFSSRYKIEDIRNATLKLQQKMPSAKVLALTEGFKSSYNDF